MPGSKDSLIPPYTGDRQKDSYSEETSNQIGALKSSIVETVFDTSKDADYVCKPSSNALELNVTNLTAPRYVFLPVAPKGQNITVKADATCDGYNTITIKDARAAGKQAYIDDALTYVLNSASQYVKLVFNGSLWNVAVGTSGGASGFTAGGDLTGTSTNQTVVKINGSTVPAGGSLTTGNGLYVTGSGALSYTALNLAGGSNYVTGLLPFANLATITAVNSVTMPAGGALTTGTVLRATGTGSAAYGALDLANTNAVTGLLPFANLATITAVNSVTMPAGGSLTTGTVLRATGVGTAAYGAVDLANASAVTGTLPTSNQASQSMGGDVTGTTASSTVAKLQGRSVASTAPSDGYVLTWVTSGSDWEPKPPATGNGGWTTGYEVDFTTLTTQNLITGGDGSKTLSDNSVWTVVNTGFATTFGVTNGTGMVITKDSTSNKFMYLLASLANLPAGADPWSDDVEIWIRATVSGGFTTANSGCFFIAEMRDNNDTNPSNANFSLQRTALEIASTATTTPNKTTYSEQNNGTQTTHNTLAVDSPVHDVFMLRGRGPTTRDLYTGTYSSGWPTAGSLSHEATIYYINDATTGNASTYTLTAMKGQNLGVGIIIGSSGTATPSVTITNLRVRYK